MKPVIFIIDSVPERRGILQYTLERAGYHIETFATTHALQIAEQQRPAAMIVAIELPDGSGITLCQRIRQAPALSTTGLILLAENKIDKYRAGLEGNADDYLSCPLAPGELVRTVESLLLKVAERNSVTSREEVDIVIDSSAMKIFVHGMNVTTTILEFRLIEYMARHQGKVFTRDALLDAVWGDLKFVTPRSVDACIRRIRRKIEPKSSSPSFLRTIRGIGYKLEAKSTWDTTADACPCPVCSTTRARLL
jgi:two-component system phosphate regulon response regulator PhoB